MAVSRRAVPIIALTVSLSAGLLLVYCTMNSFAGNPYDAFLYGYHDEEEWSTSTIAETAFFDDEFLTITLSDAEYKEPIAGIFIVERGELLSVNPLWWDWKGDPIIARDMLTIGNAVCQNVIVVNNVSFQIVWRAVDRDVFPYSDSDGVLKGTESTVTLELPTTIKEAILEKQLLPIMAIGREDYGSKLLVLNVAE